MRKWAGWSRPSLSVYIRSHVFAWCDTNAFECFCSIYIFICDIAYIKQSIFFTTGVRPFNISFFLFFFFFFFFCEMNYIFSWHNFIVKGISTDQIAKIVAPRSLSLFHVQPDFFPANKSQITNNCKFFLAKHNVAEHENFSANKYENANYCWHFHIY